MDNVLHFGVTGSSELIPKIQELKLLGIMADLRHARNPFISTSPFLWQHNGDCINADHLMARQWKRLSGQVWGHPPDRSERRAYFWFDRTEDPKPFGVRDQDIVDASDLLVAAPRCAEYTRSGTWMTVRMARKKGIPIMLVWPDGSVTKES